MSGVQIIDIVLKSSLLIMICIYDKELKQATFLTRLYNYFMVSVFGWPDPNMRECCES